MKALALFRSGAIHDGIGLYKQVLGAEHDLRKNMPVAPRLRFLENMGLNDVAATIAKNWGQAPAKRKGQAMVINPALTTAYQGRYPRETRS